MPNWNIRFKKKHLSNFSRALTDASMCVRPDSEYELTNLEKTNSLTRGAGTSYSDAWFQ